MNLPIRVRLTLWYAGLLGAIIVALGAFLDLQLRTDLRRAIDDEAEASSRTIILAVTDEDEADDVELVPDPEDFLDAAVASLPVSSRAQVLDAQGSVLAAFGAGARSRPLADRDDRAAATARGPVLEHAELGPDAQSYRVMTTAFSDAGQARFLVVALSLQPVDDAVRRVFYLLLVAGPTAVAATSFAAYWLSRKALRPVERMTSDAREIGTGQLHERVAVPASRDEVGRLALTLNEMLARIEQSVIDKHRLVADASHELRTPLAVMRAELDVSLRNDDLDDPAREVLESVREEVARVSRAVDNLLALAAAEEGRLELLTGPVDLHQAADEAAQRLRLLAASKDVSLVVDGEPLEAQADRRQLHLALTNLIENAVKFSPPGAAVHVASWRGHDEVGISVTDQGPGISEQDKEHLFDRYHQLDRASDPRLGGSGLGLSISRDVAVAHGGRLWADSSPGAGSTFTFALPSWRADEGDNRD